MPSNIGILYHEDYYFHIRKTINYSHSARNKQTLKTLGTPTINKPEKSSNRFKFLIHPMPSQGEGNYIKSKVKRKRLYYLRKYKDKTKHRADG